MAPALVSGTGFSAVLAELTDIPYMAGWPALLVLIVALLVVGLRNPYRRMLDGQAPPRPTRRRRWRVRQTSNDRTP